MQGRFLVTSRHITAGILDLANAYRISETDFDAVSRRSRVDKWDVLLSMIGTVGEPFLVRQEPDFAIKNIGLFKSKGEIEGKWLYYYLRTPQAQQMIREQARGTTQAYIPLDALRTFPVPHPSDPDEMCAITHILGTLDDKIELNRNMNETLEQMARAVFRACFTYPFSGLKQLMPKMGRLELVDSPLGKIPKGWSVKPISELADVVGGSTPRTDEPLFWIGGQHCWATPKDLAALDVAVLLDTERKVTDAGVEQISSGLLPVGALLLSSRAPIGYLAIAETPVAINQGFIAMLPKDAVSNQFLLYWTRHSHEEIVGRANGTTFLEISKSNFRPIPVVTPPTDTMKAFDQRVRPMYNRVVANTRQSRTLAAIRDALLPKLMSGEIRTANDEVRSANPGEGRSANGEGRTTNPGSTRREGPWEVRTTMDEVRTAGTYEVRAAKYGVRTTIGRTTR